LISGKNFPSYTASLPHLYGFSKSKRISFHQDLKDFEKLRPCMGGEKIKKVDETG